jgi:hypothetical protein
MVWVLRHIRVNGRRRTLTSLLHGTMANAMPQALGLQKAFPGRQVISLSGDGGLAMLLGDLLTAVQENLPIKVVVFNNGSLNFVELEQKVEGLLDNYTDLKNPDFGRLAEVIGFHGRTVTRSEDLEEAVQDFLSQRGPALLDAYQPRRAGDAAADRGQAGGRYGVVCRQGGVERPLRRREASAGGQLPEEVGFDAGLRPAPATSRPGQSRSWFPRDGGVGPVAGDAVNPSLAWPRIMPRTLAPQPDPPRLRQFPRSVVDPRHAWMRGNDRIVRVEPSHARLRAKRPFCF